MKSIEIDTFTIGDKIVWNPHTDEQDVGVFVRREDWKYFIKWESTGEELFLTESDITERCVYWADFEKGIEITEDMVRKILEIYSYTDCPSFNHATEAIEYIMAKLRSEKDPEYAEYLRLKAKFGK